MNRVRAIRGHLPAAGRGRSSMARRLIRTGKWRDEAGAGSNRIAIAPNEVSFEVRMLSIFWMRVHFGGPKSKLALLQPKAGPAMAPIEDREPDPAPTDEVLDGTDPPVTLSCLQSAGPCLGPSYPFWVDDGYDYCA